MILKWATYFYYYFLLMQMVVCIHGIFLLFVHKNISNELDAIKMVKLWGEKELIDIPKYTISLYFPSYLWVKCDLDKFLTGFHEIHPITRPHPS